MKPYYQDDYATIFHGDCRDILDSVPFDMVVTDPPWRATKNPFTHNRPGDGRGVAAIRNVTSGVKYGKIGTFDPTLLASLCNRAARDCLILCGYIELRDVIEAVGKLRAVFVWHNTRPTPIPGPVAARDVAFIVWGGSQSSVNPKQKRWRSSLFPIPGLQGGCMATERILETSGASSHPAQEPLALMHRLLEPLGDGVILDPYCGTGTTLVAAKNQGRKSIGIEIEEKYCEIAAKRLRQEVLPLVG